MASGLGVALAVKLTDRVTGALLSSDTPLDREHLRKATRRLLAEEAPLAADALVEEVVDGLVGLGPLEMLLRDPDVSDVLVNGPGAVYVERGGQLSAVDVAFADDAAVVAAVERVIAPLGLRLDRASPTIDARLSDGSRLHAVIPPAAVDFPIVAVRRFVKAIDSLDGLLARDSITVDQLDGLRTLVRERKNLIVSGGTGTGKTTLLNLLGNEIPGNERVVTIEDAAELSFRGHVVRLEGRPPNSEGKGEILLRTLLRSALRLRPDRIVIGEVRGAEALDLINALNTGHAGSMATVHANSPEEAMWRLETLALSGEERVGEEAVRRQLWAAIGCVLQLERRHGQRRLASVGMVSEGRIEELQW
ncbi:MAG: Flp pilus assembly complex ATPase component TadA [Actinobacteria bacterium]|nr:Flp pilus assembly complex ATPase component TadA [Actinomycetota bacterium]